GTAPPKSPPRIARPLASARTNLTGLPSMLGVLHSASVRTVAAWPGATISAVAVRTGSIGVGLGVGLGLGVGVLPSSIGAPAAVLSGSGAEGNGSKELAIAGATRSSPAAPAMG